MSEVLDDNLEKEENSNGFQLDFEEITPWNGANDTGKDVRMKWLRNFEKIRQNFELLSGLWSLKIDSDGKKYAYTNFPIVGAAGMTLFAGEEIKVDSIFKGLPLDTTTLQWVDGVLTVVGGTGGGEAGFVKWQNIEGKPSWITTEKPKYSYTEITGLVEELGKYVTLSTEQSVTGMKDFANGMKVSGVLFKVINGVLTLDCSIAVTGGITTHAIGEQTAATIMDGVAVDGTTITKENGVLKVVGGGGASNWDELEGKPSWITDTKPTYAWGEITQKPTTLSGYGIQASDVLNTLKTVDGSGSGLDADTLDGYDSLDTITFGGDINTAASYVAGLKVFGIEGGNSSGLGNGYGSILQLCNGSARKYAPNTGGRLDSWYSQLILTTDNRVRARFSTNGSEWSTQRTIAYITDNVASATKLQTARTIWGQSFDGTANVTGSLTSVTDITGTGTFTGANIKATDSVYVNGIRLHKTADGVITLEGNLAVTGGITQFAVNEVNPSTIMDGVVVDGTSIKKENGVLKVMNAGGGEAGSVKWANITDKPVTLAGYGVSASNVLSTLKIVDGSGSGLDADLLDGVHLISNGYGAGVKRTFFFGVSINKSYIKLGTLRTVAGTGTSTSKVMFTVRGGINYGNTNESVYEVAASTRGSIQVTSTLVRGNRELKFGYVSTSSNVEIWMAYDDNYRGTTEVEVSASSNFILSMTETNTKPSGFVEGSYRILAATTDNVTSATNADKLDGVHLNGIFTAFTASGNNTRLTIGGVTKDLTVPYANNADMLDGVQLANIVYYANTNSYDNTICSRIIPISDVNLTDGARWGSIFQWTNTTTRTPAQTGVTDNWFNQLFGATTNRIYFRTRTNGGGWTPWNKLAYITDNVASATKLQTARNLWGQSFDGTKDVTGSMTVNGNITIANGSSSTLTIWDSSAYIQQQNISDLDGYGLYLYGSSGTRIANKLVVDSDTYIKRNITVKGTVKGTGTNGGFGIIPGHVSGECIRIDCHNSSGNWITNGIIILSNGYTGIGMATPSQRLHVAGNILATGGGTFYSSDIRAKTIIEKPKLSLNSIANAPVIKFRWNGYNGLKDDDKLHIGGIAQYIEKILPECVIGQIDDFLSFDYATTGYVFSVLTARHLLSYETRTDRIIRKLKERIKRLEKQLNIENHEEVSIVAD